MAITSEVQRELAGLNIGGDEYMFAAPESDVINIRYTKDITLKEKIENIDKKSTDNSRYNVNFIENTYNHENQSIDKTHWHISTTADTEDAQVTMANEVNSVFKEGIKRINKQVGYHAIQYGELNAAIGPDTTALGLGCTAKRGASFSGGINTTADGSASLSFGLKNQTNWIGAIALGIGNIAGYRQNGSGGGKASLALGERNNASGRASAAIGSHNTTYANDIGCIALGRNLYTTKPLKDGKNNGQFVYGEVVVGKNSTFGTNRIAKASKYGGDYGTPVFTIGGGKDSDNRLDLCVVYAAKKDVKEGFIDASNARAVFKSVETVEKTKLENPGDFVAKGKFLSFHAGPEAIKADTTVTCTLRLKKFGTQGILRFIIENNSNQTLYQNENKNATARDGFCFRLTVPRNTSFSNKTFSEIMKTYSMHFYFRQNIVSSYQTEKVYNNFRIGTLDINTDSSANFIFDATIGGNDLAISNGENIMIWDIPVYFTD